MKLKMYILFMVLLIFVPNILPNQGTLVRADEGAENPLTEISDYNNGTIRTIVDYGNGTQEHTVETTIRKTAIISNNNGSNLSLFLAKSDESLGQTAKVTETKMMQEEVVMGFTKEILKERYQLVDIWVAVAYFRLAVNFDFEFGLRLPINISVEYPSAVNFNGSIEKINVTIIPIDDPTFDEFLCIYEISAIVEAGNWVVDIWPPDFGHWDTYGPIEIPVWGQDRSESFKTPMGDNIAFPIDPWEVLNIFDAFFVSIGFGVAPGFGSKKVTATASAFGDANIAGPKGIEWSEPNETFCLEVQFGGINPSSDGATIRISDYRYYFTEFALGIYLMVDFIGWIDWLINDFDVLLFEIPMNWVFDYLGDYYISSEQTVDLWFGPPDVRRDIAVASVFCNVHEIFQGGIVNITVIVENLGASTELFNVTAFYESKTPLLPIIGMIGSTSNEILETGRSRTFHFTWNTSGVAAASYIIVAKVTEVPDEFDTSNNVKRDSVIIRRLYELRVNVVDEMYKPISGARVEVGEFAEFTAVNGSITFALSKGIYNVRASKGMLNRSFEVNLNQDKIITIMLAPQQNVAVVAITLESDWLYQGKLCHAGINVTVANEGDVAETFNITVYADRNTTVIGDEYIVGTQTVTLENGTQAILMFLWDTTDVTPCYNYTITAVASVVPFETDIADNTMSSDMTVRVRLVSDMNDDGKVDIKDIAIAAICFGQWLGGPKWLPCGPYADINNDGYVDIRDLVVIAKNFGNTCLK